MVPGTFLSIIIFFNANAAPVQPAPNMLWPHPWPTSTPVGPGVWRGSAALPRSGSASYSDRKPIFGPRPPCVHSATNAVGMPEVPLLTTLKPASRNSRRWISDDFSSCSESSGVFQTSREIRRIASRTASTASCAALADSETSTPSAAAREGGIIHTAVDASEPASSARREISFILMKDSFHMPSDPTASNNARHKNHRHVYAARVGYF